MDDWELEPARDLDLGGMDRYRSLQRESGLIESSAGSCGGCSCGPRFAPGTGSRSSAASIFPVSRRLC